MKKRDFKIQNSKFKIPARIIGLTVLLLFLLPLAADAAVLRTPPNNLGLVGYWSMEDGRGSTATDFSGSGNDGSLTNMDPATDWVSGRRGTALDFDGSDDYIERTGPLPPDGSTEITVSAWVRSDSIDTDGSILGTKTDLSSDDNVGMRYDADGYAGNGTNVIKFAIENQANSSVSGETESNVQTTGWQHISMRWSSGTAPDLLINGSEVSYTDSPGSLSGKVNIPDFYIGRGLKDSAKIWDGKIDEVRVYNRALSASEVKDLYNSGYAQVNTSRKLDEIHPVKQIVDLSV